MAESKSAAKLHDEIRILKDHLDKQAEKVNDLTDEIAHLKQELDYAGQQAAKWRRRFEEEHHKFLGALHAIQAITKPGEPRPFKAG